MSSSRMKQGSFEGQVSVNPQDAIVTNEGLKFRLGFPTKNGTSLVVTGILGGGGVFPKYFC